MASINFSAHCIYLRKKVRKQVSQIELVCAIFCTYLTSYACACNYMPLNGEDLVFVL